MRYTEVQLYLQNFRAIEQILLMAATPPTPIFGDVSIYWYILDERLSVPVISTCFWSDVAMKFHWVAHEKVLN